MIRSSSDDMTINAELWINSYLLAAQIYWEQRNDRDLRAICARATSLCKSINETNLLRYFNLYEIRSMIEHGLDADTIIPRFGTLSNEFELDSCVNAELIIERANMRQQQAYSSLSKDWRTVMNGKTEMEDMFITAEGLLDRYLYERGFNVKEGGKKHVLKPNNLYLCRDAALLLHHIKLHIGILRLLRGDLDSAKEKLVNGLAVAEQCAAAGSTRAVAELHFCLGRVNRLMINTPVSVEKIWGSKQQPSKKIVPDTFENPKVDLSFLKPVKNLETCLTHCFTKSFHDHTLMRSSMMELIYLYGSKLVKDTDDVNFDVEGSITVTHTAVAMGYMIQCARVTRMLHRKLYRGVESIASETPTVKVKPPAYACEEMETMVRVNNALQTRFSNTEPNADELVLSSRNLLRYYAELLCRYQTCTPALAEYLDIRLVETHRYMMENFAPYASECILTSLPTPQNVFSSQLVSGSCVCMQFYAVDNGLTPFVKNKVNTPLEEFLMKQRKGEANLPLLSMFYAVNVSGGEQNIPTPQIRTDKKGATNTQQQQATTVDLPRVGMMSFEQEALRKLHQMLVKLLHSMNKNNIVSLRTQAVSEERPPSAKVSAPPKGGKKPAPTPQRPSSRGATEAPPVSDIVVSQVRLERNNVIGELVKTIYDAVSPSLSTDERSNMEATQELLELIYARSQVEALVDLFDFSAGGSHFKSDQPQDDLCVFMHKLFVVYHSE
jgi:hypothetical protein